jgi:predicted ATPase/DNA-binding CsgD family transcriptional regulator
MAESAMPGLATPLTSLIGREHDIAQVVALLGSPRLVTLTGPGGVGKTRLALAVAEAVRDRFTDGAVVVPLAALHDPSLVPSTVAQALGLGDYGERSVEQTLSAFLRTQQLLLVIDNFEHVLDAAPLVTELLHASPGLSVLLTSRTPLQLTAEHVYHVPPLTAPDRDQLVSLVQLGHVAAIQLFVERARAATHAFELTADGAPVVVAICSRLAGLPLAIELAAARLTVLSLNELEQRLERQLALLTGGGRDQPARQQTMRATIAWSYALLDESDRRLFRQFAIFAGGWTLDAADAVAASARDVDVLEGLTTLVASSLVVRGEQADGASRFTMLEPIRQYARAELDEDTLGEDVQARHAAYFCQLGAQAAPHLTRQAAAAWCDRLEREHDNLRVALRWCARTGAAAAGLALIGDLRDFWFTRGYFKEGIAQATMVLDLPGAAPATTERASALATRAWLALWHGDYRRAIADGNDALAICASTGDRRVEPFVRNTLGIAHHAHVSVDAGNRMYAEALAAAREVGDTQTIARTLSNMQRYDESIAISRAAGDDDTLALALWAKSEALWTTLGLPEALRLVRESLTLYRGLGGPWGVLQCLDHLAKLALAGGAPERAVRLYASASALGQKHGIAPHPDQTAILERHLAQLRTLLGDAAFEAFWATQSGVPTEQVIDWALVDDTGAAPLPSTPHGLSPRELDVLRLIVEGKSDREIGDELFISHHTVSRHVSNILGKLGVVSRAAAAAAAVRSDLY